MNLLTKLIFRFKSPPIVIIAGNNRSCAAEAVFQILKPFFEIAKIQKINPGSILKNKILVLRSEDKNARDLYFFIKKSSKPILVVTHISEMPPGVNFFAGDVKRVQEITKLAGCLDVGDFLILNFDDETVREIEQKTLARPLTFGLQKGADFRATDIHMNEIATNFKINYQENIVPVWLKDLFGKEQIYAALAAISVGVRFGLNLVELSQALKNYKSFPGRMRMIEGMKSSRILDDSENSTPFSMIEALEVLKKIKTKGRKIAVLGDILGIGEYSIGAHETIGERMAGCADLFFLLGPRTRFLVQGAQRQGLAKEKIFRFDTMKQLINALQDKIQENDLILVDGSKEMNMTKIVEEIKTV